jgi:hypothetical protein
MKRAHFVRTLGMLSVLGLVTYVVGCGSGSNQGPMPEAVEAGKAIRAEIRELQKKQKQMKGAAAAPKRGGVRRSESPAKPGL